MTRTTPPLMQQGVKVLLASDDEPALYTLKDTYREQRTALDCAKDGHTASERLLQHEHDVVIVDRDSPALDGFQLVKLKRLLGNQSVLIVIDGSPDMHRHVDVLLGGADDCLMNPFHVEELLTRIVGHVNRMRRADSDSCLRVHDLTMDIRRYVVTRSHKWTSRSRCV